MRLAGKYYGGQGSAPQTAELIVDGATVRLSGENLQQTIALSDLQIPAALGSTPRQIRWGSRGYFVSHDESTVARLVALTGKSASLGWVAWLEQRLSVVLVALVLTGAAIWFALAYGVPAMAAQVAHQLPDEVTEALGNSTLQTLDNLLDVSEIELAEQNRLRNYFRQYGSVPVIEFRKAGRLGANALTLSGTVVVFTDELVHLADDDVQLLGVYLHELGHAKLRHVETSILQDAAWLVLVSLWFGDFSGAGELLLTLPLVVGQAAFSQDLERAADEYAVTTMLAHGLDPEPFALMLQKLEDGVSANEPDNVSDGESPEQHVPPVMAEDAAAEDDEADRDERWSQVVFDYFSTHPATAERIAAVRAARQTVNATN